MNFTNFVITRKVHEKLKFTNEKKKKKNQFPLSIFNAFREEGNIISGENSDDTLILI